MVFKAFSIKERLFIIYGLLIARLNGLLRREALVDYGVFRLLEEAGDLKKIKRNGNNVLFETKNGKFYMRRRTSDSTVFKQVYLQEEYGPVISLVNKADVRVIIDAGANVGFTSIYFSQKFPNATIYSIEPSPENLTVLEKNIEINRLSNKITILPVGLWSENTKLNKSTTGFRDERQWAYQVKQDDKGNVNGKTLETIMHENNIEEIDVLKIDIEGAEKEIFESGSIKNVLAKTNVIAIELHPEIGVKNLAIIYKTLVSSGFDLFTIGESVFGIKKHRG